MVNTTLLCKFIASNLLRTTKGIIECHILGTTISSNQVYLFIAHFVCVRACCDRKIIGGFFVVPEDKSQQFKVSKGNIFLEWLVQYVFTFDKSKGI
jgi:hypothetical protein